MSVARLVLLACTLLGLAAMHTLGHQAVMHHAALDHLVAHPASDVVTDMATGTVGCLGDACAHLHAAPADDGGGHSWSVCLAVLTGLAVTVLLAWLLAVTRRRLPATVRAASIPTAGRAPPPLLALRLVELSVLRT